MHDDPLIVMLLELRRKLQFPVIRHSIDRGVEDSAAHKDGSIVGYVDRERLLPNVNLGVS